MSNHKINKHIACNVLNNLEVIDKEGGDWAYIHVEDNAINRQELYDIGIGNEDIDKVADDGAICILSLALEFKLADDYENGYFIVWGPIDNELRSRVNEGNGTPSDAIRLLRELEGHLTLGHVGAIGD